jgi:hypothetical protein
MLTYQEIVKARSCIACARFVVSFGVSFSRVFSQAERGRCAEAKAAVRTRSEAIV